MNPPRVKKNQTQSCLEQKRREQAVWDGICLSELSYCKIRFQAPDRQPTSLRIMTIPRRSPVLPFVISRTWKNSATLESLQSAHARAQGLVHDEGHLLLCPQQPGQGLAHGGHEVPTYEMPTEGESTEHVTGLFSVSRYQKAIRHQIP